MPGALSSSQIDAIIKEKYYICHFKIGNNVAIG